MDNKKIPDDKVHDVNELSARLNENADELNKKHHEINTLAESIKSAMSKFKAGERKNIVITLKTGSFTSRSFSCILQSFPSSIALTFNDEKIKNEFIKTIDEK